MAGADNITAPGSRVESVQVDDNPPELAAPGLPQSFGGAPSTSFFSSDPAPQQPSSDFLSDLDARGDKAQARIREVAGNQARDDSYIGRQLRDDTARHQKDLEESWNYERAAAGDPALRPWNADDERAKRVRGPMEQFGSVGFIFAMAASAFTRSPMTSALNAGAAAMTAIQQGDEKAYESAYKAWKDNSDLALRRFDMEHRLYEDANKLLDTDMNLWKTKTTMIAAQFNDQTTLAMLDAGMYQPIVEMKEKLASSAIKVREAQQGFKDFDLADKLWKERYAAWKEGHPNASPVEQLQEKIKIIAESKQAVAGRSAETPEQRFERMMALQIQGAALRSAEGDKNREVRVSEGEKGRAAAQERVETQQAGAAERQASRPESLSSSDAAEVQRRTDKFETDPDSPTYGDHDKSRDRAREQVVGARRGSKEAAPPTLSEEAINKSAERLISGDKSALQGLGFGGSGSANRAAVTNAAAKLAEARGISGEEWAKANIEFQAQSRGASNLGMLESRMVAAISKAQQTAPRVLEASSKVDRTNYPTLNSVIIAAEKGAGGEDVLRLGIAVETFIANYAAALGQGSTVMTDNARERSSKLLETNYSKGQIATAIDQLRIEMQSELRGVRGSMDKYLDKNPEPKSVEAKGELEKWPEGFRAEKDGWMWEKRRGRLVPLYEQ